MTSNQKGSSLIEVLLSLVVMSVAILGLIKMQTYMDVRSENALNTLAALHHAEEKLEYYRTRSSTGGGGTILYESDIKCESDIPVMLNTRQGKRSVKVIKNSLIPNTKTVEVTVSWKDRRSENQVVKLKTIISQYSEFG